MKKNCFLIVLLLSLSYGYLSAQSFGDHVWKEEMAPVPEIPSEYADADAVIINNETYSRGTFSGTFPYIEQLATYRTQMHVKIQKEDALENYDRLIIQRFKGRIADYVQYKTVDVRIRKANGEVKNYNVRDLPFAKLTEEDNLYASKDDLFIYELEDLEVGDELETITIIESKFLDQGRTVNLYSQYPTLRASFGISVPLKVKIDGRIYNNMPKPDTRTTSTNKILSWEMKNLKGVPEANSQGTIYQNDLEYFIYELNFDAFRQDQLSFQVKNYADQILQYSEDFLKVRVRKKKKLEEFYEQMFAEGAKTFGKKQEDLQAIEKVYLLNEYVAKKMQIINEELEDFEKSEGIDYFLLNGKTDRRNLVRIYRDFFERFNIPYYVAIAKSRFSGPIDLGFVSNTQIGDYFFVFKNGDGFLSINGMGGLNELPWNFYDTKCYMRDITDRNAKLQEINFGNGPLMDAENNKRLIRAQVQVNLKNNSITQKVSSSYSGLYARGARGGIMNGHKADTLDKTLQESYDYSFRAYDKIKTKVSNAKVEKMETSPLANFAFKYGYDVKIDNLLKEEKGTFKVNADEFLGHSIRNVVNAEKRTLDYHVPYLGTDKEEYYLVFDEEVELENISDLEKKVDNEYASYEMKVTQMKPNMIRIQSTYQVKKLFIPKDEVMKLDEVNQAYKDVRNAKFSFKTKRA
ncbi:MULTISPECIES: DUF3857 domain-containing protein [unclassified Aureispira]|uniref:DUF3857 domain-containing protein n=1 Tax=unclassified Aureispira TaxID=2649989 RepID=UPI0006969F47|nr:MULTISPECIES: DUF3857 domain-containing protein [unclassified Aureispira]WMX14282.1 DUF3857 domain-containing protein [Aureispira sp. CCB-E]